MTETQEQKLARIAQMTAGVLTTDIRTPEIGDELLPPWAEQNDDWVARYDVRGVEGGVVTVQARSTNADPRAYPVPTTIREGERWRYYSRKDQGSVLRGIA